MFKFQTLMSTHNYHGSETVKKVRKATESELIAYEVINKIRDNIK